MQGRFAAKRGRMLGAALGFTIVWAGVAAAEPPPPREWELELYAYGWAPTVEADYDGEVDGQFVHATFDTDFDDVFSEWDFGAGAGIDFRYQRFVMLLDGVWVQSEVETGDIPGVDADGYLTNVVGDGKLGFRVVDRVAPWAGDPSNLDSPRMAFDVLAGARYWWLRADPLDLEGELAVPYNLQTDIDWVDPLVGMRLILGLMPQLSFSLVGDIGGFDIGNSSELTWMVHPMLNWRPIERMSVHLGYKHLRADKERPSTNKDMDYELSGPTVGLGVHF
jgi:hypothetical protein